MKKPPKKQKRAKPAGTHQAALIHHEWHRIENGLSLDMLIAMEIKGAGCLLKLISVQQLTIAMCFVPDVTIVKQDNGYVLASAHSKHTTRIVFPMAETTWSKAGKKLDKKLAAKGLQPTSHVFDPHNAPSDC